MKELKDKKIIGCIAFMLICIVISFVVYGMNKDNVFKDKYMKDIFVEEDTEEVVLVNKSTDDKNKEEDIVVEIKGEVLKPDVYVLKDGSIIKELIDRAGGLTELGDASNINRADKLKNHQLIVIPNKNDVAEGKLPGNVLINGTEEKSSLININTATAEELKKITGIGDSKAQSIIEYREKNNGFKSIEDIKNVGGIGEKTYEKFKDEITC